MPFWEKKKVEKQVQPDQKINEPVPLEQVCAEHFAGDKEMCDVMSQFLIVDPGRQLPLFDVENTAANAEEKLSKGRIRDAVIDFAMLAKIEIYNQDKEKAQAFLERIIKIPEGDTAIKMTAEMSRKLLDGNNLEKALETAKVHYQNQSAYAKAKGMESAKRA